MSQKSILFVCGGRRTQLARLFIEWGWDVYALDKDYKNPITDFAQDVVEGLQLDADAVTINQQVQEAADKVGANVVLPLHDDILLSMALKKDPRYVISPVPAVAACCDKRLFENRLMVDFSAYYPYIRGCDADVVVKPRYGCGSGGVQKLSYNGFYSNLELYGSVYHNSPTHVVQRRIFGTEYTVDCYRSPYSVYEHAVARIRLRVDKGEVIDSVIARNAQLEGVSLDIARSLGLVGPFCFQWIVEDNKMYCIEANARFGGGCTLTIAAGCDMISMVENDWLMGGYGSIPNNVVDGALLKRSFYDSIFYT